MIRGSTDYKRGFITIYRIITGDHFSKVRYTGHTSYLEITKIQSGILVIKLVLVYNQAKAVNQMIFSMLYLNACCIITSLFDIIIIIIHFLQLLTHFCNLDKAIINRYIEFINWPI